MRHSSSRILHFISLLLLLCHVVVASDTFRVDHIEVNGLKRISRGTVLNYLPVHRGDTFKQEDTAALIRALYETGFFSDVSLQRHGNTLVINLQERPTIGSITITGNKQIPTEQLLNNLKNIGLTQGHVYDSSVLDNVRISLQNKYYEQGNYTASVKSSVSNMPQNRVAITIEISEGAAAKIHQIKILGNEAFSTRKLLHKLKVAEPKFWSFLTKEDQYSREKLDASLEALRGFYMDQGYLQFKIESVKVAITPDKREVYLTLHLHEGEQFHVKGFKIAGDTAVPIDALEQQVQLELQQVFSRTAVMASTKAIGDYLADYGYAFAEVKPVPEVDEKNSEVFLTFYVTPGRRYYIRRILFVGNMKTEDHVLRREMRIQEGGVSSLQKVKLSEQRLNMLGYFKGVRTQLKPVPGIDDQLDLEVDVAEVASAKFSFAAGYSDTQGLILNGSFNQPNFLGTGSEFSISVSSDQYYNSFSTRYFNPYYTESGIGRGVSFYATTANFDRGDPPPYSMDQFGLNVNYSIPMAEFHSFTVGYGIKDINLSISDRKASAELLRFKRRHGEKFANVVLDAGWSYRNFDRALFPTRGLGSYANGVLNIPVTSDSFTYYKVNAGSHLFYPLVGGFIFTARGEVGYGNGLFESDEIPFYENYRAGGLGVQGSVRGFKGYSIGPHDSNGNNLGGNFLVDGSLGLIVPLPFAKETLRSSVFVDAGNVYTNVSPAPVPAYYQVPCNRDSGPVRYSAGMQFEWNSPFGPLVLSLAKAFNTQTCDNVDVFQFTVGTSI